MAKPQTIQIFLPDGNPRGVRIAEITNRTVKAVLFPRNQYDYMLTRDELRNVGFYFLFGDSQEGLPVVYIGEAEDCSERLKNHQKNKDFWNYAVVIISKINAFTKSHVKFLEHTAIKNAKEVNRWKLDNSSTSNLPHITESMEADMLDCFDTTKILLSTLGFPLFDAISREKITTKDRDTFRIKGVGIVSEGNLIDEGFVVFKGSEAKLHNTPSCHKYLVDLRNVLLENGILLKNDSSYRFTEDYVFSSPSTAGSVILGRPTNGWIQWKNMNGKSLDEVKRKNIK